MTKALTFPPDLPMPSACLTVHRRQRVEAVGRKASTPLQVGSTVSTCSMRERLAEPAAAEQGKPDRCRVASAVRILCSSNRQQATFRTCPDAPGRATTRKPRTLAGGRAAFVLSGIKLANLHYAAVVTFWAIRSGETMRQPSSAEYRAHEARERALAEQATLANTRDTHLRAAERWKVLAARVETGEKRRLGLDDSSAPA